MNPFLHQTVAQSSSAQALKTKARDRLPSFKGRRVRKRLARTLRLASLVAAMAWAGTAAAVDLNTATLDQLQGVRGIGPKTARIILEERQRAGRFRSFSDLSDRVRGIGPRRAQALQAAGLSIPDGMTNGVKAAAEPASGNGVKKAMKPARSRAR